MAHDIELRPQHARLAPGAPIRGRALKCSMARTLAFSGGPLDEPGWPQRNLHTDIDKALEAGLPGIIVSGTQFEGLLLSHLVGLFGEHWYRNGRLEAKFVKSVLVDETVAPLATVCDIQLAGRQAEFRLDVACENQDGEKALVGQAQVSVPAAEFLSLSGDA